LLACCFQAALASPEGINLQQHAYASTGPTLQQAGGKTKQAATTAAPLIAF
jgi:hypothetical protein